MVIPYPDSDADSVEELLEQKLDEETASRVIAKGEELDEVVRNMQNEEEMRMVLFGAYMTVAKRDSHEYTTKQKQLIDHYLRGRGVRAWRLENKPMDSPKTVSISETIDGGDR